MKKLKDHMECINDLLARYGVRFGLYKNGEFKEQLFPFDPIPRVIPKAEFDFLEKGLIQRVKALNKSLRIFTVKKILLKTVLFPNLLYFLQADFCRNVKESIR